MTMPVRIHGELRYSSRAKARAAAAAFDANCWDFCVGILEVDGATIRVDHRDEVSVDGLEHFEDEFAALADAAMRGSIRLDWQPDEPSKLGPVPRGQVDPWALGLTHLLYPKHGLVVARVDRPASAHPTLSELIVAFRRAPKFAMRYYYLHHGNHRVVRASWPGVIKARMRAYCVDFGFPLGERGAPAFGVVLFDESGRESDRLFAGELMFHELAFSPDGTRLAGAGYKGNSIGYRRRRLSETVVVWEIASRKATKLPKPTAPVRGLRWIDDATVASETDRWSVPAKSTKRARTDAPSHAGG